MTGTKKSYEAPKIVVLGSLHERTLTDQNQKRGGFCDINCFHSTSVSH